MYIRVPFRIVTLNFRKIEISQFLNVHGPFGQQCHDVAEGGQNFNGGMWELLGDSRTIG